MKPGDETLTGEEILTIAVAGGITHSRTVREWRDWLELRRLAPQFCSLGTILESEAHHGPLLLLELAIALEENF